MQRSIAVLNRPLFYLLGQEHLLKPRQGEGWEVLERKHFQTLAEMKIGHSNTSLDFISPNLG